MYDFARAGSLEHTFVQIRIFLRSHTWCVAYNLLVASLGSLIALTAALDRPVGDFDWWVWGPVRIELGVVAFGDKLVM
jgi:hypothetical protein